METHSLQLRFTRTTATVLLSTSILEWLINIYLGNKVQEANRGRSCYSASDETHQSCTFCDIYISEYFTVIKISVRTAPVGVGCLSPNAFHSLSFPQTMSVYKNKVSKSIKSIKRDKMLAFQI